jgi:hypothetical protein
MLKKWLKNYEIDMKEVIAYGDNYNDIFMLEEAGLGIAMGNAESLVKQKADKVIENNTKPGIAKTIKEEIFNIE